jgi:hypothetical protein
MPKLSCVPCPEKKDYYFPGAIQERSSLTHSSNRFNKNKPYDQADRSYLKAKLRGILKETIAQDQPIGKSRRKSKAGVLINNICFNII